MECVRPQHPLWERRHFTEKTPVKNEMTVAVIDKQNFQRIIHLGFMPPEKKMLSAHLMTRNK